MKNIARTLATLTDRQLIRKGDIAVRTSHELALEILDCLIEIDQRSLYLKHGYSSLFDFCTRRWHYSPPKAGRFIAAAQPTYAAALTVTPVPGTEMYDSWKSGAFELPDQWGMLQELQWMLEEMDGYRGPFHANHASNYLPLKLRMPKDRESAIGLIKETLANRDDSRLRPEWRRGL